MENDVIPIEKSVSYFIAWCANEVPKDAAHLFKCESESRCRDKITDSPIERLLSVALQAIIILNGLEGIDILPQVKIGVYRVDFIVSCTTYKRNKVVKKKEVIVECDSQQFHERTEKERRYEKRRDRFLQGSGYKVFHYTGAEIFAYPMKIAAEIIAYVSDQNYKSIARTRDAV